MLQSSNPSSQRSVGSSSGGTSTRSSCPEPPLFVIDEFLQGIPQAVESCLGKDVARQADKQGVFGSPDATHSNHSGYCPPPSMTLPTGNPDYTAGLSPASGNLSPPSGCPPLSIRTGSPPASVLSGMTGGGVNGIPGYSGGAGFAAALGMSDLKDGSEGFSSIMEQFQNMAPGVRSLQNMMKHVLSGTRKHPLQQQHQQQQHRAPGWKQSDRKWGEKG